MTAPEIPRRRLIRATAAAGIGGLLVPGAVSVGNVLASTRAGDSPEWGDDARPTVLDSRGTWGDLGIYFAEQFGDFGRSTWYDADWVRVIAARRQ